MHHQIRIYTVNRGQMREWVDEWRDVVLPLRRKFGFEVLGAWVADDDHHFIWIIGHEDFATRDAEYYASDERSSLDPDPARHLAHTETRMMTSVL
jgi:hypothetical protein